MRTVDISDIRAMRGNGSSMRKVLEYFLELGAEIKLVDEVKSDGIIERHFLVHHDGLMIPLRAYNLNFYCVFNSALALTITNDKLRTHRYLEVRHLPVPRTQLYAESAEALRFLESVGTCVVKPRIGAHGDGITTNVQDPGALTTAMLQAQQVFPDVLLQEQVAGEDYRLLFINYEFVAAVKRTPAAITGDGTHTVRQLVEDRNAGILKIWRSIRDGESDADATKGSISKTPIAEIIAARGEAFLEMIPDKNEIVSLLDKANVSLGGQTEDCTGLVSSKLTNQLSRTLRQIGLPICGVDVLSTDISSPPNHNASKIIELNAAPGLRLHELPSVGRPREVCKLVADRLISHYRQLQQM